jgi:PPOX class probable F420-dependent enzyme
MTPEEIRTLLTKARFCVVGYNRTAGPPALSPVYHVMDGDDLLISTTATRAKAKVLRRRPEVSVCVLADEQPSGRYVTIYGRARIEEEGAVELMMRIGGVMTGAPLPESARPAIEERARREQRVVLRVTPEAYVP